MKVLLPTCLLALTLSSVSAAPATSAHVTVRPLVRYLTATLHLHRHKARLVQRAVLHNPLALSTPEQVGERLRPVLSAAQFEQYWALQNEVSSYEMLSRLAAQR